MRRGLRIGLTIAMSVVLASIALVAAGLAWLHHDFAMGEQRLLARAQALCDSIVLGSDITLASRQPWRRVPTGDGSGGAQYRYQVHGGHYDIAECRVEVDGHGKVLAKRFGLPAAFPHDPAASEGRRPFSG